MSGASSVLLFIFFTCSCSAASQSGSEVHLEVQTLRFSKSSLVQVKQPRETRTGNGVIYEVPCKDWESVYIGETGIILEKCLAEHKNAVKKHEATAACFWDNQYQMDWMAVKTRATVTITIVNYWKVYRMLEALHMQPSITTNHQILTVN